MFAVRIPRNPRKGKTKILFSAKGNCVLILDGKSAIIIPFYIRRCVGMADEGDSKSLVLITRVGSTPTTGINRQPGIERFWAALFLLQVTPLCSPGKCWLRKLGRPAGNTKKLPHSRMCSSSHEQDRETQFQRYYFPRCQMSRSYSAMVRSEENIPALAMFTRHLRRQPMGSQA